MPIGPGKYDQLCRQAREALSARAVVLIVIDGAAGSGISIQGREGVDLTNHLPTLLRRSAEQMDCSFLQEE
jgi:hypothetical protein